MPDHSPDLKTRTKRFALAVMELCSGLPKTTAARVIGNQLLRSGTSVGAQYREGVRARSDAEYASKVQSALQELEESMYWLELLDESGTLKADATRALKSEADELAAILVTCSNKARRTTRTKKED
ncbi:MAG: four helix bundle protein [Planctomycetota bacterium]|jgi:four helix bundle protein